MGTMGFDVICTNFLIIDDGDGVGVYLGGGLRGGATADEEREEGGPLGAAGS